MKLSELNVGKSAIIKSLPKEDSLSKRLLEMGYHEGIKISAVLSNGNLCEYKLGETLIALKNCECEKILVI